jgi:hypothetical protein
MKITPIMLSCVLLIAIACNQPSNTLEVKQPNANPVELHFAWSLPAQATVTQVSEGDFSATMRYTLTATPQEDQRIAIHLKDLTILMLDGVAVDSSPGLKAEADMIQEMLRGALPPILVTPKGKYSDLADWEEMIALSIKLLKKDREISDDDPSLPAIRAALLSPANREQFKRKAAEPWMIWVGTWVDFPKGLNGTKTTTIKQGAFDIPIVVENSGAIPGRESLVRLSYSVLVDGEAAKAAAMGFLKQMEAVSPNPEEAQAAFAAMQFKNETRFWVETEPASLKPHKAGKETLITVIEPGKQPLTKRESTSYSFDWQK